MDYFWNESHCPACGEPIDYCHGHGKIGDPRGYRILCAHEVDDHGNCHPNSDCRVNDPVPTPPPAPHGVDRERAFAIFTIGVAAMLLLFGSAMRTLTADAPNPARYPDWVTNPLCIEEHDPATEACVLFDAYGNPWLLYPDGTTHDLDD